MLSLKAIHKAYQQPVISDLSIEIDNGLFGLLGPNGAGKSTLMKMIATLVKPDSGSIHLHGVDVLQQPEYMRQNLGYLPQEFGVYPRLSASSLLDHFAKLKGVLDKAERKQQVEFLLARTNLWKYRNKAVSGYSGGMKQRFGVAQALLANPKLVVVDEPTAGLDPFERNRFYDLLSDFAADRIVILSTHIVEDVSVLCSNMAILTGGQVVAQGQPASLLNELKDQVWKIETTKEGMAEIGAMHKVISWRRLSNKLIVHVQSNEPIAGFEPVTANLEDVYFSHLNQHDVMQGQ